MIEESQYNFSTATENTLLVEYWQMGQDHVYRIPTLDDDSNLLPSKTTK